MPVMSTDGYLARQAGVISRAQALSAGLSRDAVDARLRTRRWRPLHPRVYLAGGHRYDDEVRVRAALLWAGPDAVLSGAAAAWWHGMTADPPATVAVTVPRRRGPHPRPGVAVRRHDLDAADRAARRGLAVTAPPLTVLDAAVELGAPGSALLDDVLQKAVPFDEVRRALHRNPGAPGATTAARLLAAAADRATPAAERLLARLLRDAGVRGWHRDVPVAGHVLAVVFPAARLAVEVDGWARHLNAEHAAARRRDALARAGWTVRRYPWSDLTARPRAVLDDLRVATRTAS
jgi:very-short-patch-repair endonuclease